MTVLLQPRASAPTHTVAKGDTLVKIANAKCPALGWKVLARFNFGTDLPAEVLRALTETGALALADALDGAKAAAPETIELDPTGLAAAPTLKLPVAWTQADMAMEQAHKLSVRPILPANAVAIDELDKWFVPELEACAVKFRLEGLAETADKLQFEVYGNKYCECTDWNEGLGTYGDPASLIDEPIYKLDVSPQATQRNAAALPDAGWKGEANTGSGLLARKTGSATKRHINVAFSPYTAHFRYWKLDGDKTAHLVLEPFWPQFDETQTEVEDANTDHGGVRKIVWNNAAQADRGMAVVRDKNDQEVHAIALTGDLLKAGARELAWDGQYAYGALNSELGTQVLAADGPYKAKITTLVDKAKTDSLKIKWSLRHGNGKLKQGLLRIVDGKERPVFLKALLAADLSDGEHNFDWDGKYAKGILNSAGKGEVIAADMPYRLQIQAHSEVGVDEGLALAAMHTEVRLYTGKSLPLKHAMYRPFEAVSSASLMAGTTVPDTSPDQLPVSGDGTRWYRYMLGQYGFHPGPVTASGSADAAYKTAMIEFKRSVPADGTVAAGNFARQSLNYPVAAATAEEGAATQTAIEKTRASDKRSTFGDPAKVQSNSDAPDLNDAEVQSQIGDPTKDMIVWVDDRQYYTQHWDTGNLPKDEGNALFASGSPAADAFGLHNCRGAYTNGEDKVKPQDESFVARPWVPLRFSPMLLKRTQSLDDEVNAASVSEDDRRAMLRAMGPLRVDWSFDELPLDISAISAAGYDKKTGRPRRYVAWAIQESRDAAHVRKDTGQSVRYQNCREAWGGSRPHAAPDSYQKKLFGCGDLGLRPWKAVADDSTETVATVLHDHIAASQKTKAAQPDKYLVDLFEPLIGSAGAYFNPSNIAGDGYRLRADIRFAKFTGYDFPNLTALAARYPSTPQAYSARLRMWRRTSVRGFFAWGPMPLTGWQTFIGGMRKHYRAASVYLLHEGGSPSTFPITDLFDPSKAADRTRYKDIVKSNLPTLTDGVLKSGFVWPWDDEPHLGWEWPSDVNEADWWNKWWRNEIHLLTWHRLNPGLLMSALQGVEKQKGLMRGHLLGEFVSSGPAVFRKYQCNGTVVPMGSTPAPPHEYWYLEKGPNTSTRQMDGQNCPFPGCEELASVDATLTLVSECAVDNLPVDAVGQSLGATWLFPPTAGFGGSHAGVWTHEVGHHRHLEHAASAPGANDAYHDSERNEHYFDPAPTATFTPSVANGDAPLAVTFTNNSTGAAKSNDNLSANPQQLGVTWHWDFGDGLYSTEKEPTHTFRNAGTFAVKLSISSGRVQATHTANITVAARKPDVVANFTVAPAGGAAALEQTFTDSSTGTPTGWLWIFGDGASSTEQSPKHTYAAAGKFDVKLIAHNAFSHAEKTLSVTITPPVLKGDSFGLLTPTAKATASAATGAAPLSITFTDKSSEDPEAVIPTYYRWDFGDGSFSTDASPVHVYAQPGNYTPVFTVGNDIAEDRLTLAPVVVTGSRIEFAKLDCITPAPDRKAAERIRFKDQSTKPPTAWLWLFGDGFHSTSQHPDHDYEAGTHKVELYAVHADGVSHAEANITVAAGTTPAVPGVQDDKWMRWDRRCIMSYSRTSYSENEEHFCGKCVLRQRGWMVSLLGQPGPTVHET